MDIDYFLKHHQGGLGEVFGITFTEARPERVVAQMRLTPRHETLPGIVHGGVVMALGDCGGAFGAVLNLPPGHTTGTIESKTNFLRRGSGDLLEAVATPIHIGRTTSVWRSLIHRGPGGPIAEVTQTQIVLPDRKIEAAEPAAAPPSPETAPGAGNGASAGQGAANGALGNVTAERKRQIFEGASRVISEKGFANATIREIAAASGMPVPTMYQYIERKEDLLFFIYEYFMRDYTENLRRSAGAAEGRAGKLAAALSETLDDFDRNRDYIKLMFQETRALSAEGRQRVYELDRQYIDVWQGIIADLAREDGRPLGDPELLANFIYFLCAIWPLRHWTIGKFDRAKVEAALTAFILGGLGVDGTAAAPPR